MCVDYRALNETTIKNRYPLPRIDDSLDQLKEAIIFSKLNLRSRYYQIKVCNGNVEKTTCQIHMVVMIG
jgi:hypothetical protein